MKHNNEHENGSNIEKCSFTTIVLFAEEEAIALNIVSKNKTYLSFGNRLILQNIGRQTISKITGDDKGEREDEGKFERIIEILEDVVVEKGTIHETTKFDACYHYHPQNGFVIIAQNVVQDNFG